MDELKQKRLDKKVDGLDEILCHICLKEKKSNEIVFSKAEIYACSACYIVRKVTKDE